MNGWRAGAVSVLAALGVCLAFAAGAAELQEGRDFRLVSPPLTAPKDTIEVAEFFWYGCPHCFDFEPELAAWVKKLPAGVSFRRVPALFPAVQGRLQQARELGPAAGLTGVPAVMVQGRYLALTRGDYEELLAVIEGLVERARMETGIR